MKKAEVGDNVPISGEPFPKINCVVVLGGACCMFSGKSMEFMKTTQRSDVVVIYAGDQSDEALMRKTYHIPDRFPVKGLDADKITDLGREWAPSIFLMDQKGKLTWKQFDYEDTPK